MSEPTKDGVAARKPRSRRKTKPPVVELHPVDPLPSLRVRLHMLRRGTYATDFGLNAIFARRP